MFSLSFRSIVRRLLKLLQEEYGEGNNNLEKTTVLDIDSLIREYSGKNLWHKISINNSLLFEINLHSSQLIYVGGYKGDMLSRLINELEKINTIHVYEPIPKFFQALKVRFDSIISRDIKFFNNAISANDELTMVICDDSTHSVSSKRRVKHLTEGIICVPAVKISDAIERLPEPTNFWTLFMNCEGSEYEIVEELMKLNKHKLPKSIFIQTHSVGDTPNLTLLELRKRLSREFLPIFCADFAWDVWLNKSCTSLSPRDLEEGPFL